MLPDMFRDHTSAAAQRAMSSMLKMKQLDIAELERAAAHG